MKKPFILFVSGVLITLIGTRLIPEEFVIWSVGVELLLFSIYFKVKR